MGEVKKARRISTRGRPGDCLSVVVYCQAVFATRDHIVGATWLATREDCINGHHGMRKEGRRKEPWTSNTGGR